MSNARFYIVFALALLSQWGAARAEDMEINVEPATVKAEKAAVPLPAGALVQSGPAEGQERLALSPDGRQVATAGKDGKVRLYDTANAALVKTIEAHSAACNDVRFTPDGKRLVSCGADIAVKEWDLESGKQTREFKGHTADVKCVAPSPDGLLLASSDAAATIRIWDMKTGRQIHEMTGHKVAAEDLPPGLAGREHVCTIDALTFSPNSRIVLSEADDETARLWDAIAGKEIRVLPHHDGSTASLAFSPDGISGISTRGQDYCPYGTAVRLWDVYSGEVRRVFTGHTADVTCLAFSPDGRYVFSGARDRTLRQWEVDSGLELRRFVLSSIPFGVACAPDGKFAVSVSPREGVAIWDLNALPPTGSSSADLKPEEAWQKLAANNYHERALAFRCFVKQLAPAEAVAQLAKGLRESLDTLTKTQAALRPLIEKLDDDSFGTRLKAYEDLQQLGPPARDELAAALAKPSLEVRAHAAALLKELGGAVDIRQIAAVEILGALNTAASRAELARIASEKRPPYSTHAQAVLARVSRP